MITSLKLTNFRKVISDEMVFTRGINVIRGANEASKSTRLEAIAYALFGSRALHTPLDATVTWGKPLSSMKVELTLNIGGESYTFTRGKSGSEIVKGGTVFCTGQNETSALASSFLGADVNTASKLLISDQNSVRGVLTGGPKELSIFLEDLASFDTFDRILDSASKKLALGSPALIEAQLKGAENTLEAATANLPAQPDESTHALALEALRAKASATEALLLSLEERAKDSAKTWQDASALYMRKCVMEGKLAELLRNVDQAQAQVSTLTKACDKIVDIGRIDMLKSQIAEADGYAERIDKYSTFLSIPDGPVWKGDKLSFDTRSTACNQKISQLEAEAAQLRFDIKTLKSQRFDSTTCSKCGQTLPDIEHIVATNAAVDKRLAEIVVLQDVNMQSLNSEYKDRKRFEEIESHARRLVPYFKKLLGRCLFDDEQYPMRVVWHGHAPSGHAPDAAGLRRQLADVEAEVRALEASRAQLKWTKEHLAKAITNFNEAEIVLREFTAPNEDDIIALTKHKDKALAAVQTAKGEVVLYQADVDRLEREFHTTKKMWDMAKDRVNDANKTIESCKADLAALGFNNALVAKLRKIRPIIANKLWNTVLSSVSVMFSQMRREESWIVKDDSGFKVNGQAVESLSGSTLDILGLAIRCALLRTFLPQCGLLVLDEPMHGCDAERSEAMLGFLKSVGFQQTLLVSHEEVSESVADNLIQL